MANKSKIMTAEQAFNFAMNKYASLYSAETLEEAKLKYFDHVFNTIGNGYRDLEEFIECHKINKNNKAFLDSFPEKFIGTTPLYTAYTKVKMIGSYEMPESESRIEGTFTAEEIEQMPEVVCKIQSNGKGFDGERISTPYPNFSKTYSIVWRMDMKALDPSWTEAAIWYYENIKPFFEGEHVHLYHGAAPINEKGMKRTIEEFEKHFVKYKKEDMNDLEYFKAVSDAYNFEYNGNTEEFITKRWEKQLSEIKNFIDETVTMLKNL